jgi:DNA-binding SARP family transcriptional activator/WD40 repeat protein
MERALPATEPDLGSSATTNEFDFLVLGPMAASRNGIDIHVGGVKQRTILAMLVAASGRPISLDQIVDAAYGDETGDGARNSVYTYVSTMRRHLGKAITKEAGGYVLDIDPRCVDAHRFETEVHSALAMLRDQPETAAETLRRALAIWRGHAYADVEGRGWFQPEVTRLSELRLTALESRIEADLALGRHGELLGEIEALTNEHPLRERFRAQHMLALYRAGRQTEALRSFARTRSYLADEVGVEPSPDLQELEQRILEHDRSLDLPGAPELAQRAVVVVDIAPPEVLTHLPGSDRARLAHRTAIEFEQTTVRHGGTGVGQRGSALYAALPTMRDAIDTVGELRSSLSTRVRTAIDFGEVEIQEAGEVSGPPLRRCAGMVAAAHPGQVLLSVGAHQTLLLEDEHGWTVRSLGSHPIGGVDRPQQIFQLVFPGDDEDYPALRVDAPPAPLPAERGSVGGYEIRQPVFSDLSGTTYRAYQPSVGREVMITAIDPVWANRTEFVSRFEVETHLVTRLQHPHILPVLDYWRDSNGAYLVSPPVGRTLAEALESNLLDEVGRHRLIEDIGEGLTHAHRRGVIHGSLSLSTVVVDESVNAYLTGVGFVVRLSGAPLVTSSFTAPESVRGEPLAAAADVFSLGVLVHVLLAESRAFTQGDLAAMVARATADQPDERYPSVDELLDAFRRSTGAAGAAITLTPLRNPYKGLEAFTEVDAGDFYGRSDAVADLLRRVSEHPLVALVGPSGCGKSSLVEAGLIPAVRAGSRTWVTTTMFPGTYPFVELESALARVAVEDPRSLGIDLEADERALVQMVKRILPAKTTLLLVIDQFEELFTLTRDTDTRDRFLNALVNLAADKRSNVRVVITLRADFFDRPLQYPGFGDLLEVGTFPLATPGRTQLAEAIRLPAESLGVSWESGLIEQIIDDVADAPGTLPLLQYALTELFAARDRNVLTHDDYHGIGGVLGALGSQADRLFQDLDPDLQETARQVFLRLLVLQPSGEQTRRRARLADLNAIGEPTGIESILRAFGEVRLLTFDRDPITRSPTVEVAHEALLTRWPRLAQWISNAREDLLLHQRLADAVAEWEQSGRDEAFLLGRGRLEQFASWAEDTDLTVSDYEKEYLGLSEQRAGQERARRRRVRNLVMSGFAVAALVASVFGVMALISRQEATDNAVLAHARELVASAFDVLDEDPELSLLLAVQAAGSSTQTIGSLSAIHESLAAHSKILTYTWPSDQTLAIDLSTVISPDGRFLVASGGGTYVEVVDADSGERLWGHDFGGHGITRATFTRDGAQVAVTYGWTDAADGRPPDQDTRAALGVHVLDSRTGEPIQYLPIGERCGVVTRVRALSTVETETGSYLTAELGNDSNCNFTGDTRGGINPRDRAAPPPALIDLDTGESTRMHDFRGSPVEISAAEISSDGRLVARQRYDLNQGVTDVIDWDTGLQIAELDGWLIGISADGSTVLTVEDYEIGYVWDLSQGQPTGPASTISGDFEGQELWLSPNGDIVGEVVDSEVLLFDAETGGEMERLATGLGSNGQVSFSDDESRILVTEAGGRQAVLFDREAAEELGETDLCHPMRGPVTPMNSGGGVVAVRADCPDTMTQFVIAAESPKVTEQFASDGLRSALSGDGSQMYYQTIDQIGFTGSVQPIDTATGEVGDPLPGLCKHLDGSGNDCLEFPNPPFPDWVHDLEMSADGSMLAMAGGSSDGVTVWDLTTRKILATPRVTHLTRQPDRALSVAFSPDGNRLAVSFGWGSPELWLLSTEDWEAIAHFGSGAQAPTEDLVFTHDGATLIATDDLRAGVGRIVFMDGQTLEVVHEIRDAHDAAITGLASSDDGSLLASSGVDGFVRVWDVASRNLVHEIPVSRGVGGVVFVTDQQLAVTDNTSGTLRMFTIDTTELLELARSRVTRAFTTTECATYRIDPCPTLEDIRSG